MGALTERFYPLGRPSHPEPEIDAFTERIIQLWGREAVENPRIYFNHYWQTSIGLPTTDPGDVDHWKRRDNRLLFLLERGFMIHPVTQEAIRQGYPYGLWPRRLQAVINTLILRGSGDCRIYVGQEFRKFLHRHLGNGVTLSGGKNGTVAKAKDQFMRMSAAHYGYHIQSGIHGITYNPAPMIEQCGVFLNEANGDYWPQVIVISKSYRDSLCRAAVPVDMDSLLRLDGTLEHDVYSWVSRRIFDIQNDPKTTFISWDSLRGQFGKNYSELKDFQKEFRKTRNSIIKKVYPDLRLREVTGGWSLAQSRLSVDKRYWGGYTDHTAQRNLFGNEGVDTSRVLSTTIIGKRLEKG